MVWAVILAAGESKRMGKPKLLLPFGESTIIGTVVNNTIQSKADKTLVVLGSDEDKVIEKIDDLPVKITVNTNFREGMLSSIQWGFESLPEKTRAVLVVLGDQPSISSSVINKIIDGYNQTEKGIVLPVYNKKRGHPVLIDMKYRDEVKQLSSDIGMHELIHNHAEDVLEVEVGTQRILNDIDTVEDYNKEIEHWM